MGTDIPQHRIPSLPAASHSGTNPAAVYLASLAKGPGRAAMRSSLAKVAGILGYPINACPWSSLRHEHVAAIRARLADAYAPASANKMLSAIRGTLRAAWRMEQMSTDDYTRAVDVSNIRGSRLPAGRALDGGELRALFDTCADGTASGARDAAALALMFGCGLRRDEAAGATVTDYNTDSGELRILGKGNRERTAYATGGGKRALDAWLAIRGQGGGPILAPVNKGGTVDVGVGLSGQALRKRIVRRAAQAGIPATSPHDLRRSFVTAALEAGADVAMVQKLVGHASPQTTVRYDRRPEAAKAAAARLVHVPYAG